MFQLMQNSEDALGVLSITPKVDVAKSHRKITLKNGLDLTGDSSVGENYFRNMGAYILRNTIQEAIAETRDIIDVLNLLNLAGQPLLTFQYLGTYLHIETAADIKSWKSQPLSSSEFSTDI